MKIHMQKIKNQIKNHSSMTFLVLIQDMFIKIKKVIYFSIIIEYNSIYGYLI